ncbi:hypothetical protein BY457_10710 [Marinilabilia salmonicolor]|jgi:hypothetical protein|uniref:hypothetical protein n=1 Tax=Marinilabilia salmonicolor TaxID=989 RepID=UPI000D42305D|nr:hypothetical protein [Marinilabilia salmonicolor]PRY99940.1 hypothetical protein BY457_10710 [Marinilabilia salmonicolor]
MITSASMNKEFRGVVTQFDVSKEYGFIKEEITGKSFFSRYEKNEQILWARQTKELPMACPRKDDVVTFRLRSSDNKDHDYQACRLTFIKNPTIESIKERMGRGVRFYGRITFSNSRYFINDTKTGIVFPVRILVREKEFIDFEQLDTNPVMEYILEQRRNPSKVFARLKLPVG